ncbi:MAG: hypothetical protein DHS20C11_25460 [Lysobacteraceae bacterium]|nr:MAG: hypothetical protein DHS20C11_25460 [Xanthomonadaceae bacterium]
MTVSKSWVATALRDHAYQVNVERELVRKRLLRPGKPNRVWGVDLTGVTDSRGETHTVLGAVDHGTRRLLKLRRMESKRSIQLLWELVWTCVRFGRPRFMRTDNEAVFRSRRFRWGLKLLGVRVQVTDLHCPWQNGRVERVFGTLKETLAQVVLPDHLTVDQALVDFEFWYNQLRPHSSLDQMTPWLAWKTKRRGGWVSMWDGVLLGYARPG